MTIQSLEVVIGLEIHVQLATRTKLFASDQTTFGQEPNTLISPVSLAYPGSLPVLNKNAVKYAVMMGLACGCDIASYTIFDRKNYFYPDLPKGYQITQDRMPICENGRIPYRVDGKIMEVPLFKIHLEEDAGKLLHDSEEESSVDYNRAGVPLIEIVTQPSLHSAKEAVAVMEEVRRIVRFLEISDGNMQEGSLRCDANVSLRPSGSSELGRKVEIKNINSFKFVEKALNYEIERQSELIVQGREVKGETRMFDSIKGVTYGMRDKEDLNDYRYFPEPDLPPVVISDAYLETVRSSIPTLSHEWYQTFIEKYGLTAQSAEFLSGSRKICNYYIEALKYADAKALVNWISGPIQSLAKEKNISYEELLAPQRLGEFVTLIEKEKISFTVANNLILPEAIQNKTTDISDLVLKFKEGEDEDEIASIVEETLAAMSSEVMLYRSGKKNLLGLFMGKVMKAGGGKLNPQEVQSAIKNYLEKDA